MQPLIIGVAIDSLTREFALNKVLQFAALIAVLSAIKGVFQYWMRVIIIGISRDVEFDLRNDLFSTADHAFLGLLREVPHRRHHGAGTNDLNAVRMMLGPGVMYWTETMLTLVLAVAIMAWVDWPLALVALAPAPIVSLVGRVVRTHDPHALRTNSEDVCRYQQPGAGELRRCPRDSRVCPGRSRNTAFRNSESRVHPREHPSRASAGNVHAGLAGAGRDRFPGSSLGRRSARADGQHIARQLRDVQQLHGHARVADDRAGLGSESDGARHALRWNASTK